MDIYESLFMAALGALGTLNLVLFNLVREEVKKKSDASHVYEDRRRLGDHDSSIGELFSKASDNRAEALAGQNELLKLMNSNQSALLGTLSAIAARATAASHD